MSEPREILAHLTRSDHRIEVLEAIRAESRSRGEIRELADASRVTVGRIITDLEERGWIVRNGQSYRTTPEGAYVAREVTRLVDNLAVVATLPPVYEWLPGKEPTFDLRRLADATVVTVEDGDLIAPMRRALELIGTASELTAVANGAASEFTTAMRHAVADGQTTELILSPETIEAIRDNPEMCADVRAMLETGRTTIRSYQGAHDLPVLQVHETGVALCDGDHQAMVETTDSVVRDWAAAYLDRLRTDCTVLSSDAFTADALRTEDPVVE